MPDYPDLEQIAGTVSRAPEVTETPNGKYICKFGMAVSRAYGPGEDNTKWVNVAVWNEDLGASVMDELYKGAKVACEGNLKERVYEGKTYYDFSAMRVGVVAWIAKAGTSKAAGKAKAVESDDPF